MTSDPDAVARLLASYDLSAPPEWKTADEASRISVETFAANLRGDALARSTGRIRLAERGGDSHSALLESVGQVQIAFQRAIRGVAAGLEGVRAVVGRLPAEIVQLTNLRLIASPLPGSIVLQVQPDVEPADVAYPDGQMSLDPARDSLVDRSAVELIDFLTETLDLLTIVDSGALEARLSNLGPRAASSIKSFADAVAASSFDVDLSWDRSTQATVRAHVDSASAEWLSALISGSQLDAEPILLRGVLRTVSDRKPLDLELAPGEVVGIDRGDVDVRDFRVGQQVTVEALVRVVVRPGGDEGRTYTAVSIQVT